MYTKYHHENYILFNFFYEIIIYIYFYSAKAGECTDTKEMICQKCTMTPGLVRAVNVQINWELFASYTYMNIASFFDRSDVSLKIIIIIHK